MGKLIIDESTISRIIRRICYEIIEKNKGVENIVIVGIRTKGVNLGKRIKQNIEMIEGIEIPFGELDIDHYRDDVNERRKAFLNETLIPFKIEDMTVILVDDVLYTGRTIRAAMDAIMDVGRAEKIELAVLVDRGHRQLPIKANYIGKNIPTSKEERIKVSFKEIDGLEQVDIITGK